MVPETSGPKRAQVLRYCFEGVVCQCFLVRAHASTATSTSIPELNFSFQAFIRRDALYASSRNLHCRIHHSLIM